MLISGAVIRIIFIIACNSFVVDCAAGWNGIYLASIWNSFILESSGLTLNIIDTRTQPEEGK